MCVIFGWGCRRSCISQAEIVSSPFLTKTQSVHSLQQSNIPPTSTITYFYDGNTFMNAEDDNGDMSTYLDRTVRTIVNVNTQTVLDTQCLFTDGKNAIAQTDSAGTTITSTKQYNPFGQPTNHNSSTNFQLSIATNPFAYDGYYNDSESGLYYLNARYYSPTLMQFISMDTYDLANRYSYCDDNPIGNIDPTGHNAEFDGQIAIMAIFLAIAIVTANPEEDAAEPIVEGVINKMVDDDDYLGKVGEDIANEASQKKNTLDHVISKFADLTYKQHGKGLLSGVTDWVSCSETAQVGGEIKNDDENISAKQFEIDQGIAVGNGLGFIPEYPCILLGDGIIASGVEESSLGTIIAGVATKSVLRGSAFELGADGFSMALTGGKSGTTGKTLAADCFNYTLCTIPFDIGSAYADFGAKFGGNFLSNTFRGAGNSANGTIKTLRSYSRSMAENLYYEAPNAATSDIGNGEGIGGSYLNM